MKRKKLEKSVKRIIPLNEPITVYDPQEASKTTLFSQRNCMSELGKTVKERQLLHYE